MAEKWLEIKKGGNFVEWGTRLGVDPLCARVIRNRGIENIEDAERYLKGGLKSLHDPFLLPDMDRAVEAIREAVRDGIRIRIVGDYDVDGVTSTVILCKCLTAFGASVSYAVPDRVKDGYGINESIVRKASEDGTGLIITCDNGIAAKEQIRLAYELGMKVVVTDHHQVPYTEENGERYEILPECEAVVDPHRDKSIYPFRGICGAMVAFKTMQALCTSCPSEELSEALEECIQFAALGTVCDIMELKDENRDLVREGIKRIENTGNTGLKCLIEANSLSGARISTYSLGFVIGPCINSTGRLESASDSVALLLSEDREECFREALRIRELNDQRKTMTVSGVEEAMALIKSENLLEKKILVLFLPHIHESIVGLVAGKIKESFNRPVLVITRTENGLKGSARSIPAYNMFEKLSEVKELFTAFGGHAMAAGFSLKEEDLPELRRRLEENSGLTSDDLVKEVRFDAVIPMSYVSKKLIKDLSMLEPLGTGNPGALFVSRDVRITDISRMGREGKYGRLTAESDGRTYKLTYFGNMDELEEYIRSKNNPQILLNSAQKDAKTAFDICYEIKINEYKGNEYIDYNLKYLR